MSSPLAAVVTSVVAATNPPHEFALFVSDDQRRRMVRGVIDAYVASFSRAVVFDTSRQWCNLLGIVAGLFPGAKVLCCVRSPAWIMDSTERFIQRDPFKSSKLFGYDLSMTVFDRVPAMLRGQYLGAVLNGLKQAWCGEYADRLVLIRYESLAERPADVLEVIYGAIGEDPFKHDFDNVEYEEPEFDRVLGLPGFHTVRRKVECRPRTTCLPPELFQQNLRCFWDEEPNPKKVLVV
jgi:sulfotransferase